MMIDQAEKLRGMFASKEEGLMPHEIAARVLTVSSGKGGVGKTNFAANLAIELSKHNKKVVIIDADLGLANIEVVFGVIPKYNMADMLSGSKNMIEVLTEGPMGIKFASGGSGLRELMNVSDKQLSRILENFSYLDSIADIILIDTGAGISNNVVNFIQASMETIIITTPEPTSVTDAYALIKATRNSREILPAMKLIVNRTESDAEGIEIYQKLSQVSERFLEVKLENLGHIPTDPLLVKAVKRQQPINICYPNSEFTEAIRNIALKLLNMEPRAQQNKTGFRSFLKKLNNIFHS